MLGWALSNERHSLALCVFAKKFSSQIKAISYSSESHVHFPSFLTISREQIWEYATQSGGEGLLLNATVDTGISLVFCGSVYTLCNGCCQYYEGKPALVMTVEAVGWSAACCSVSPIDQHSARLSRRHNPCQRSPLQLFPHSALSLDLSAFITLLLLRLIRSKTPCRGHCELAIKRFPGSCNQQYQGVFSL